MKNIQLGYIALFRQFLDWEWFTDINTCHLFIYCLLRANHKNKAWRGIEIKKGQFITSFRTMSQETGLSVQEVRTALKKLLSTQELTHQPHRQNSIITVNNYSVYQNINTLFNKRATTDNKEIIDSNTSYINNTHTIEKGVCAKPKISKEDREILKTYAKKSKADNIQAYIHTLVSNGGYLEILEQEKKRLQTKEKQQTQTEEPETPINTEEDEKRAREIIEQTMKQHKIKRKRGGEIKNVTTQ